MPYVARMTANPEADLKRGWSAWGGLHEVCPLSLADVDNAMTEREFDEYTIINAIDDGHSHETDDGWELNDDDETRAAVAEWIRDELDIDVRRCPVTGLYAVRHHDGLSAYECAGCDSLESAIDDAVANHPRRTYRNGGCTAISPVSYHPTPIDGVYVFEVKEIGMQADS
jgi:hypothetical protein